MADLENAPVITVAIVDDDPLVRRLLRAWLEELGHQIVEIASGREALARIDDEIDAVCLDLGLEDVPGLDVMRHLRGNGVEAPFLVVTAERAIERAVEAMREGAYDYLVKPLSRDRLEVALKRAVERRQMARAIKRLQGQLAPPSRSLLGDSAGIRTIRGHIDRVRDSDVSVCILGESGTGKELVARAIHDGGRRAKGPFVPINCAAIPASLQESELFGHERGAFTGATGQHRGRFEQAHKGTLFLDELGEMSPATQAALLRALQERTIRRVGGTQDIPIDVRIICATHRDLQAEMKAGRFREDLYFRLVVYPIHLSPLRDRREDVPILVSHFLSRLQEDTNRKVLHVASDALDALCAYDWPGNVRELQNVVHRAMLASDGDRIDLSNLPAEIRAGMMPNIAAAPSAPKAEPVEELLHLETLERRAIVRALEKTKGSVERAAKLLGMGRATLYRRLAAIQDVRGGRSVDLPDTAQDAEEAE